MANPHGYFLKLFHCFHQAAPVQAAPVKQVENGDDAADDDDIDLFGSDEEDEETARIKQERMDAYAAKKSKKPALIAKSSILLDVKPVNSSLPCHYIQYQTYIQDFLLC